MPADGRWDLTRYFRGLMSEVYTLTICKGKYFISSIEAIFMDFLVVPSFSNGGVAEVSNQNGSVNRNN